MTPRSDSKSKPAPERRRNRPLREVLDELLAHIRDITRDARTMSQSELDYSQQRLEWLSDEVWRLAVQGEDDSAAGRPEDS
jgi:hypothetical protein